MFSATYLRRLTLVPAATLALTATLAAQTAKPVTKSKSITVKATIEAIDQGERLVTLKGPEGNYVIVQAGPEVKRFDKLKVGDVITATYTESIALNVRKPGDPAPPSDMKGVNLRNKKVGATGTRQQTMSVTIENVDPAVPSVTVKGPEGHVYSFRVSDPKNIEGLKAGDTVDITFTRSLLVKADAASH
jgi:Cu/Ag efflux protein CusF